MSLREQTMAPRIFILLVGLNLIGCPSQSEAPTVVEECSKTGERCRITKGQLGVCMLNTSGEYYCAPQH